MSNKDNIFDTNEAFLSYVKKEGESSLFAELCAMVGLTKDGKIVYRKMQNRAKEPNLFFLIDPYDYLSFIQSYKPIAVFHSHLAGDENPSDFDEKTSENCCLAFLIYSICTEKFSIYEPRFKEYSVSIIEGLRKLI